MPVKPGMNIPLQWAYKMYELANELKSRILASLFSYAAFSANLQ